MKPVKVSFEAQAPMITQPPPKARKEIVDDGSPYIELVTGGRFYYNAPTWDIGAVAHALSLQCRFTGQCRKFYSVAEHSVLVSRIMEDMGLGDPMEGLLHDAVESVLSDVARPAKQLLADYKALDKALDTSMRKNFNLPEKMTNGCIQADAMALLIEAKELMPSKGLDWNDIGAPGVDNQQLRALVGKTTYMVSCWTSDNAKEKFMQRMTDVRRRLRGLR
jgi:hypothetical protein